MLFYVETDSLLGLNSSHIKVSTGRIEYSLSNIQVSIRNLPLVPNNPSNHIRFEAEVKISLSFGWESMPPMRINIKTAAM